VSKDIYVKTTWLNQHNNLGAVLSIIMVYLLFFWYTILQLDVSLSYPDEISVLGHFNVTAPKQVHNVISHVSKKLPRDNVLITVILFE